MGEDTHEIPRKPPVPAIFTDSVLQSRIKEARKKGYEERLVLYNQELAYHQGRWQLVVSLFECPNCGQSGDFKGATDYCTKM